MKNPNEPLPAMTASTETFDLIAASAAQLEDRLRAMAKTGLVGDTKSLNLRIRAAAARMAQNAATRHVPASKEAKFGFLLALQSGLSVQAAAAVVGVAEQTLRRERRRDPVFMQEWEAALEARTEPIEERLQDIAMTGDPGAMATIKASEIMLRATNQRHRNRTTYQRIPGEQGEVAKRIIWVDDGLTPD